MEKEFTTDEVANILGLRPRGVLYRAKILHLLPHRRIGKAALWTQQQVLALRNARSVGRPRKSPTSPPPLNNPADVLQYFYFFALPH